MKGKPSLLGLISGAVAGLVAVTPASGYAGPIGALALGFIVSPMCLFFVSKVKNTLGYDDALDVFGIHCIGGITGALATGMLVSPDLGGVGITDYTNLEGFTGAYNMMAQMKAQATAVVATLRVVGRRLGDPVQARRSHGRPAARRRTRSAKASTSPTTASALTICEQAPRKNENGAFGRRFFCGERIPSPKGRGWPGEAGAGEGQPSRVIGAHAKRPSPQPLTRLLRSHPLPKGEGRALS